MDGQTPQMNVVDESKERILIHFHPPPESTTYHSPTYFQRVWSSLEFCLPFLVIVGLTINYPSAQSCHFQPTPLRNIPRPPMAPILLDIE